MFLLITTGIGIPEVSADSFGTDVSSHQGVIAYKANGFQWAHIKLTEGTNYVNPYVTAQEAQAKREKIPYGFYIYLKSAESPEAQARFAYRMLGKADASNPKITIWLDVEENTWDGNHFRGDEPKRFLDEFKRLSGRKATGVYMNREMIFAHPWYDLKGYKLWQAIYPTTGNTQYYPYASWLKTQTTHLPTFGKADIVQYGDGGGLDWNYCYGDYHALTGVKTALHVKSKPCVKRSSKLTASFKQIYVLDAWHQIGNKWYASNRDFSIPIEDYHNYIPAQAITLTDRFGKKLKNQWGLDNNGQIEYFMLNGKYPVLARAGAQIKLEIAGEPVWLHRKYVLLN